MDLWRVVLLLSMGMHCTGFGSHSPTTVVVVNITNIIAADKALFETFAGVANRGSDSISRAGVMIVSGGENVYSAEVENALGQHPAVATSAVIGIPSDQWGESVHAIIILNPNTTVTPDDLRAHCHTLIAGYKCPRSIEFRTEPLPLSGANKVLKIELRKPFWEGQERQIS